MSKELKDVVEGVTNFILTHKKPNKTYLNVIKLWGNKEIYFATEEMSELTKQLMKYLEGRGNIEKITEEMTDVEIQLGILKLLFNNTKEIFELKPERITRLQQVLDSQTDKEMLEKAVEPQQKLKIVTLIGSARFREKFIEIEKKLTWKHYVVLIPYWDGMINKDKYMEDEWEYLMCFSYNKIGLADLVYVINVDGYIGEHTRKEIEYAEKIGKEIKYLEKI